MVSWIVVCIAISALSAGGFSFPIIEEHQELAIPETIGGHEELFEHQIGLSHEIEEFKPKYPTSYQSFHLDSKKHVPIEIKTVHPFPVKHYSGFGGLESSIEHSIPEIEPIGLKLHGI